ncbi:collagen-like triple helix repeat-containing protein [Photorhabdus sp. CRCIA-P01]|uniref:collagen-like triple helix repeat-containing protein n=1 Tax=Photorhabdus sp. CRCIA-P01 TaxID=2019570 RepID=UPI0013005B96|nr:collagen-like protein [Photorhabdus sp. CRCIA-P01]
MDNIRTVAETLAILHQNHRPFGLERQPKQLKTSDFDGPVIFSNDLKTATVPPAFFTVQTIQELKALGGVPDSRYGPGKMESYHPLPEPFSAERLANVPGNHIDLCKAFRVYIYGDSALVKDYEEMLNAKRFPMKIAFYSGEEITISEDNPLIIMDKDNYGEPVVLVYNQITIEPEGKVICYTNGRIETNVLQGIGYGPYHFFNKGVDGEDGVTGTSGSSGVNGVDGSPGLKNKNTYVTPPTPGTDGTKGSPGMRGSDGEPGSAAEKLTVVSAQVGGMIYLESEGGDGGNGGHGGDGGDGGHGGDGGYCGGHGYVTTSSLYRAGNGGNGADGGDGGNGGNGGHSGDGGDIEFNYSTGNPDMSYWSMPGLEGASGRAGKGGKGGDGGSAWYNIEDRIRNLSCSGRSGKKGINGKSGEPGKPGKGGRIYINGKLL